MDFTATYEHAQKLTHELALSPGQAMAAFNKAGDLRFGWALHAGHKKALPGDTVQAFVELLEIQSVLSSIYRPEHAFNWMLTAKPAFEGLSPAQMMEQPEGRTKVLQTVLGIGR